MQVGSLQLKFCFLPCFILMIRSSSSCNCRCRYSRTTILSTARRPLVLGLSHQQQPVIREGCICCFFSDLCLLRDPRLFLSCCRDARSTTLHSVAGCCPDRIDCTLPRNWNCGVLLLRFIRCLARSWIGGFTHQESLLRNCFAWTHCIHDHCFTCE